MTIAPDIVSVLSKVELCSDTRVMVAGEAFTVPLPGDPPAPGGPPAADDGRPPIVSLLGEVIYTRLYTRARGEADMSAGVSSRDFVTRLSAANVGHGTFEPGWRLDYVDEDSRLAVSKDGLRLFVPPALFLPADGIAAPGARGRVRVGKELRGLMPGFYVAIGDVSADTDDPPEPLVRLYWHLEAKAAVDAVHAITLELNRAGVPFRMKVLSHPATYVRADAGVLYVPRRHFIEATARIAHVYTLLRSGLRAEVPLFTKRLAPGLGLAEDPGIDEVSFGQHRSRLMADAIWASRHAGHDTLEARLAVTADVFARAGLDPSRPYLRSGGAADYAPLPLRQKMARHRLARRA